MRLPLILVGGLLATLCGCGASHGSRLPGDSAPADQIVTCPETTNVVRITIPADQIAITATDGLRVARNVDGKAIGVANDTATAAGDCFILGRDGSGTDGAFDHAGTYDAARYPYHLALYVWTAAPAAACAGTSSATSYFGLSGSWTVDTPTPTFAGSAYITSLTYTQSCWTDSTGAAANTAACDLLRGSLSACFKVATGS